MAKDCNYVLETGTGFSTQCFAANNVKVVSIDLFEVLGDVNDMPGVTLLKGWSITDKDMIKYGHKLFRRSRYKNTPDESVAFNVGKMIGETDLIRKAVEKFGVPDMWFSDCGEYCGYAEWSIMKDIIPVEGIIALHDIHYPKSVKNSIPYFYMLCKPDEWELVYKSMSKQGLAIFRRLK